MKSRKITVLVFLGCAAFVLGSAQAPLDDDEFDIDGGIDGSGFVGRSWPASGSTTTTTTTTSTSTAAPKAGDSFPSSTSQDEPEVDGSGSGETSDDDEDDYFDQIYPDDGDYTDVYSDYDSLGYSDESERSGNRGGWGSSKSDDVSSEKDRKNVGVVHAVHPVDEKKPVLGGHKPKPVGQPAQTPEEDNYDDDDYDDNDLVIPPEGTLQEINNVREELEKVEEKERELELELERQREENSVGGMDGLGTKAVDRNTSFFAQPGILAAVVGGAVVGLLCAILLVMLIVYRMRKKDEGSYPVDEPKRSLTGNNYSKNKDYYA